MARRRTIARTLREAERRKYDVAIGFSLAELSSTQRAKGTTFSKSDAEPGDIAWSGPCEESGTHVVCYYDENMDPSICRNEPC